MKIAQCNYVIEVLTLSEVLRRSRRILLSSIGRRTFEALLQEALTLLVEEHEARNDPTGGRSVRRDGSQLQFLVERSGTGYRMVVVQFDYRCEPAPIILDGLCLVHDERILVGRYAVHRDGIKTTIEIIPAGQCSDQYPRSRRRVQPTSPDKPMLHRRPLSPTSLAIFAERALAQLWRNSCQFVHRLPSLGACPSSRWIFRCESDSVQGYEQTLSPLEDRPDAAAACERRGLCA